MFFSILIPVYNVEKWLSICIDSVLAQQEQDYEIILVDDGSTDSSGIICDRYASCHENIRVIHKENEGLLLTRRRAIREARGDWFVHLDSDDYMMPGFLAALRTRIDSTDADLVLYKIVYGTEDPGDFSTTSKLPFGDQEVFCGRNKKKLLMQFLAGGYITAIHQKAARRDIVDIHEDYQTFRGVSLMEDHLQSLPLLDRAQKPVFLDYAAVYYRYNGDSITKQKGYGAYKAAFLSVHRVYQEELRYHPRWELNAQERTCVAVKQQRNLCRMIGQMAKAAEGKAQTDDFRNFVKWLSQDALWQKTRRACEKERIGAVCSLCVRLVNWNQAGLLRAMYRLLSLRHTRGD